MQRSTTAIQSPERWLWGCSRTGSKRKGICTKEAWLPVSRGACQEEGATWPKWGKQKLLSTFENDMRMETVSVGVSLTKAKGVSKRRAISLEKGNQGFLGIWIWKTWDNQEVWNAAKITRAFCWHFSGSRIPEPSEWARGDNPLGPAVATQTAYHGESLNWDGSVEAGKYFLVLLLWFSPLHDGKYFLVLFLWFSPLLKQWQIFSGSIFMIFTSTHASL